MASTALDPLAICPSIEQNLHSATPSLKKTGSTLLVEMPSNTPHDHSHSPSHDNCDGHHNGDSNPTISISSATKLAGQTVAPFLAKHIPERYAPLGLQANSREVERRKDPNTKYCYRHRPGVECRKSADEPSMEMLQRVRISPLVKRFQADIQ